MDSLLFLGSAVHHPNTLCLSYSSECVERLSRKSLECSGGRIRWPVRCPNGPSWLPFELSWEPTREINRTFQTVSRRGILRSSHSPGPIRQSFLCTTDHEAPYLYIRN